jgi:hypothetical protein
LLKVALNAITLSPIDCIGGVMVSVLASGAIDCGFETQFGQIKENEIGICCFSSKHAVLRNMRKDWLGQNQDNVSEWHHMEQHVYP